MKQLEQAAKYYLNYQGQKGTAKQVEKLIRQFSAEQIVRMAAERGFKS